MEPHLWLQRVNMTNCCNQRRSFFEKYGSIDVSLLIAYWMMAGYLDPIGSIEEGYEKGFNILLEFKRKGILSETLNQVSASASSEHNNHCSHKEHCTVSNLGFDDLLDLLRLAKPTLTDGVLLDETGSVLLLDGSQASESALASLKRFRYIACFGIQDDSVKALLENVDNPSLLLLRDCETSYSKIDYSLEKIANLTALEISGASYTVNVAELTNRGSFPEDFFSNIPELTKLQHLNLSGMSRGSFPEDFFSKLKQLRWLILRKCYSLQALPSLNSLINLEVLDLSFSRKLYRLAIDSISSPKLRILESTHTAVRCIPQLETAWLTHLMMSNSNLRAFRPMKHPHSIQLLDLSYASQLRQVDLSQLDDLQVLDLSHTGISTIDSVEDKVHLRKLILRGCKGLEKLPALEKMVSLEVLDVAYCVQLIHLPDLSNQMKLDILELSKTQLYRLPSFPNPSRLRKLSLRKLELGSLETLSSQSGLVELDLFNVKISSSGGFNVDFLESLKNLQTLNLSHTCVVDLPALANHKGLKELFLADCPHLRTLPDVNILKNLEKMELPAGGHYKSLKKLVLMNACDVKNNASYFLRSEVRFQLSINELFDRISDTEQALATPTNCNENTRMRQKLEKVKMDLVYIQKYNDGLNDFPNLNKACKLLRHFKGVSHCLSESLEVEKLVQTVAKLKLLLPRTQNHESERLEPVQKKKEPKFFTTKDKTNAAAEDIIKKLVNPEATQVQTENLLSSYESLTRNEKHCLLCFSIFPLNICEGDCKGFLLGKGIEIKEKLLIHWWLGEGFIHLRPVATQVSEHATSADRGIGKKMIPATGREILIVLTEKGFIEPVTEKGWETGRYCMHPFVHAFVTEQAKRDGFLDFSNRNGKLTPIFESSKRACLLRSQDGIPSSCQIWAKFTESCERLQRFKTVKTLFNVNESVINIQPDWFSMMKDLSVLHLGNWHSGTSEHIEIGDKLFLEELRRMEQLKFFSLQGVSTVTKLPDSVCNLTNLIILDLKECHELEELPAEIGSLKNLTYLDISNCHFLAKLPKGVMLLLKLEVLKGFVIYDRPDRPQVKRGNIIRHLLNRAKENLFHEILHWENEVCTFKDLLKLENLRVLSIVVNRENFPNREELKVFKHMENLRKLTISWKRNFVEEDDSYLGSAQNGTNIEDTTAPEESPANCRGDSHCSSEAESENLSIKGVGAEADATIQEASTAKKPRENLDQIEKLKLWGLPYETAPDWLVPNELRNLQKLYIRGGKLKNLAGGANGNEWKVTTLSLRYLPNLELISPAELKSIFPNLTDWEQYQCSTSFSFSTGSPH